LHRAERTIAERLMRLANGTLPWPWIDPDKALPWVEGRIGLSLAESQAAAIRLALTSKVLVMTGGPGVGKTTIVNAILRILAAKGTNILLCAPCHLDIIGPGIDGMMPSCRKVFVTGVCCPRASRLCLIVFYG
jgi:ATP-dependent exoDNAse (exonuclease V) alpha subunit